MNAERFVIDTNIFILPDAIIAATAICHDAVLVTNDAELYNTPGLQSRGLAVRQ